MTSACIVVFGVASDASVDQYDGHRPPRGIMLRWFLPDLDFPAPGFDVYRAVVPDIPPLPFDDINVAAVSGQPQWEYIGIVTLFCASGLKFEPSPRLGWNRLVIDPKAPVTLKFSSPAWRIQVRAETVAQAVGAITPMLQ